MTHGSMSFLSAGFEIPDINKGNGMLGLLSGVDIDITDHKIAKKFHQVVSSC